MDRIQGLEGTVQTLYKIGLFIMCFAKTQILI